jgi:hypothetical protein
LDPEETKGINAVFVVASREELPKLFEDLVSLNNRIRTEHKLLNSSTNPNKENSKHIIQTVHKALSEKVPLVIAHPIHKK